MRLLLDTNILIPLIEGVPDVLPAHILAAVMAPEMRLCASAASLWEIAIKNRLGKLPLGPPLMMLPELIGALGIEILAVTAEHALAQAHPEPTTKDPFDRMLLAQCAVEQMRLLTLDRVLVTHPLAIARP